MSQTFADDFVKYLQGMVGDRGKMAALRKGLIENQAQVTWLLLARFLDFDRPYQMKTLQTVGGLFGHNQNNTNTGNFGNLCHQMLDEDEKQKIARGESGAISRHFQYALAAQGEEIFPRVRRLVMRAQKDEIPVNYVRLTDDLLGWQSSYRRDRIKLEWGKEFWKAKTVPEAKTEESEVEEDG